MRSGAITSIDPKLIEPRIVTGLDALGKRRDGNRLMEFIGAVSQSLGPQAILQYCDPTQIIQKLALSMGVSAEGIVKPKEQLAAEQRQAQQTQQMQTMLEKGTAPAINQIGETIRANTQRQGGETARQ